MALSKDQIRANSAYKVFRNMGKSKDKSMRFAISETGAFPSAGVDRIIPKDSPRYLAAQNRNRKFRK